MKKLKFITLFLTIALVAVSCESYDDYDTDRDTVAGFTKKTQNINSIPQDGEKSTTVDVFASDVKSFERTFSVVIVPVTNPEENTPTAENNYRYDATVTIPANERLGTLTVTGVDNSLTSDRTFFMLSIQGGDDVVSGGTIMIGLKN